MEEEKVILEGPIEDYENLALKIQSVYRGKKVRDELKKWREEESLFFI